MPTESTPAARPLPTMTPEFWDRHYRDDDPSGPLPRPNPAFAQVVGELGLTPGRALELACGRGGDALWLALLGWQVTAVDVAGTALAAVEARSRRLEVADRLTTLRQDLATPDLPPGPWDLVSASYFHTSPSVDRDAVLRHAADRIAPGGLLLTLDHASSAPWSWSRHQDFPTPQQTYDSIALGPDWTPVLLDRRTRIATGPAGDQAEVADNLIVVRRDA